ncbi:hypothetical protein K435DRAFT_859722 [Dendrothele bispora CBS 962.96]|uniref:Uncharacterized protein n=1 Tax=Dendrothele bispora (strain CBS 962.96) TaxID=1314807 RepID=A0A4S8M0E6_DENBC|nr:hypothetical protein K435DRAFT_859722 [Dendrothele bispora CBS 962.96]
MRYAHTVIWDNLNVPSQFLSSQLRFHYCSYGHMIRYGAPSQCHQGHEIVLITNCYHTEAECQILHNYYHNPVNTSSIPTIQSYEDVLATHRWHAVRTFGEAHFL